MKIENKIPAEMMEQYLGLYEAAFPGCEKKPFSSMLEKAAEGSVDMLMLEEDGEFAGLAITMKAGDLVLLDYFAIAGNMRSRGYGSRALQLLSEYYKGKRFFLEIESVYEEADNLPQRMRRKQFYLKNGLTELGIMANIYETDMELLGRDMSMTYEEYVDVYRIVYGEEKTKHIRQLPGRKKK